MSLAARCTHCRTVFRISGPQLAAAQGWVRCGQCNNVFDATSNLVTPQGQAIEVPTVDVRQSAVPQVATARTESSAVSSSPGAAFQAMPDIDLELPDLGALKAEAEAAAQATPPHHEAPVVQTPSVIPEPAPVAPAPSFVSDTPAEALRAHGADHADVAAPTAHEPTQETDRPTHQRDLRDLREPAWVEPSSVLDARPGHAPAAGEAGMPASSEAPPPAGNRWALALVALLGTTLMLLFAYTARGHVAQAWPDLRPTIVTACASIGCRLPALRLIDAVDLQGSSLSLDDQTGHHRLRVQLHHRGDWPVQMPAFDLSILDSDGTVIARRMLDPSEFTPAVTTLQPGAEVELTMALNLKALEPATMGSFRVSPFYP
jgi:predicted Zn finger-like uncharacterized protein